MRNRFRIPVDSDVLHDPSRLFRVKGDEPPRAAFHVPDVVSDDLGSETFEFDGSDFDYDPYAASGGEAFDADLDIPGLNAEELSGQFGLAFDGLEELANLFELE